MKIKRLIVSKYKNVEKLNLKFKTPLISLLVGRNGLGKSNLIEILALIFRDLDLLQTEEDYKEWAYDANHFEYFIQYECKNSELRILCREDLFKVYRRQKGAADRFLELSFSSFKSNKKEEYLPKFIIGYYSGENKRIRNIMHSYEKIVWTALKKNEGLDQPLRKLFFAENYHAQMVLLTLLLYKGQNNEADFQNKANELINRFCSFNELEEINLILKQPSWFNRRKKNLIQFSIENLEENLLDEEHKKNPFWGAKGKADKIITYFYNNAESHTGYYDEGNPIKEEQVEKLELKSINRIDLASKVYTEFGHPSNFFDAFESLFQIESIHSINLKVKSKNQDLSFDFSQISEGEQQLITVLGLILIMGREDCLFLLDEPDTHLNPIWQREYVKLLTDFNLQDENSHIIVATHSPLIVQSAENADIFLYKEEEGKIKVDENDFKIHNWRIDQVLASDYFQFPSTRPLSLDSYMILREKIISEADFSADIESRLKEFENEFGVLPTGETKEEIESLILIKSISNRLRDQNDKN
jgi:predicted ATPase